MIELAFFYVVVMLAVPGVVVVLGCLVWGLRRRVARLERRAVIRVELDELDFPERRQERRRVGTW